MATLVEHYRVKDITAGWTRIQQSVLEQIPEGLLLATVRRSILTRNFFPKPPELLADAEWTRQEVLKLHPYEPCSECDHTGWAEWVIEGVKRVKRCDCFQAWRKRLDALGAGSQPLALERGKDDE